MNRRALVVDDDTMVAGLIRSVLESADFDVDLANNAAQASRAFEDFDPDVVILDISLGRGPSGFDLAHLAHVLCPAAALLILTRYPDLRTARATVQDLPAGCGFLSKQVVTDPSVLIEAVEGVIRSNASETVVHEQVDVQLARLTRSQLAVLHMLAQGLTTSEIARRRERTPSAVEKMLGEIYSRLDIDAKGDVHPRAEAIRIYASAALLPDRESVHEQRTIER